MEFIKRQDAVYAEIRARTGSKILSAGTLPAILRELTTITSATQYDIWAFLLHIRQYSTASYILQFLLRRYQLDVSKAEAISEQLNTEYKSVDGDIPTDSWLDSVFERHLLGKELFKLAVLEPGKESSRDPSGDTSKYPEVSEFFIEVITVHVFHKIIVFIYMFCP